ncbi:hypothetical protein H1C71_015117, partial [Ictidomys tridecemlineatus]
QGQEMDAGGTQHPQHGPSPLDFLVGIWAPGGSQQGSGAALLLQPSLGPSPHAAPSCPPHLPKDPELEPRDRHCTGEAGPAGGQHRDETAVPRHGRRVHWHSRRPPEAVQHKATAQATPTLTHYCGPNAHPQVHLWKSQPMGRARGTGLGEQTGHGVEPQELGHCLVKGTHHVSTT